jgi:hypothetical protein
MIEPDQSIPKQVLKVLSHKKIIRGAKVPHSPHNDAPYFPLNIPVRPTYLSLRAAEKIIINPKRPVEQELTTCYFK